MARSGSSKATAAEIKALERRRRAEGVSVRRLAERAGYNLFTLYRILQGHRSTTLAEIRALRAHVAELALLKLKP